MGWDWTAVNTVMERNKSRSSSPVPASPSASERRRSSSPLMRMFSPTTDTRRSLDVGGPATPRPALPTSFMSSSPESHYSPRSSAMQSPVSKATGIVHHDDAAESTSSRTPIPNYPDSLRPSPSELRQARSLPPPPRRSVAMTPDSSAASTPHSTPTRAPGNRMTSNERAQRYTPSRSSPLRVSEPSLDEKNETAHSSTTTESWSEPFARTEMRSPAPSPNLDAGSLGDVASRSAEQVHSPLLKHATGTAAQRRPFVTDSDHRRQSTGHIRNESRVLSDPPHIQETVTVDRKRANTNSARTEILPQHSAGLAKVQENSFNTATDARMKSSGSTQFRASISSSAQTSQAASQRQASDSFRSDPGQPIFEQLPASSRGESKSAQTLQPKLRAPLQISDLQKRHELPEEYSAVEEAEQTWSTSPGLGAAAARTPRLQQSQFVPGPGSGAQQEPSYLRPLGSPLPTNEPPGRTSNAKLLVHWFIGLFFIFLFLFVTLPYWIPYVERTAETQAVLKVEGFLRDARDVYDHNSTTSTAAKFNLHAQICQIDSIRCNIVHHEPQLKSDFFDAMVLRYQSDHFDPPCPAVGCLGRPAPALPAAIEEVVGDLFANVSSKLMQLDGHFVDLERVLRGCTLRQEPLLELLRAIVGDWTREQSWFERCDRLLQRARMEEEEEEEQEQQQQDGMSPSKTLHQATIQSCRVWMFAHRAAVSAGAAEELALSRWKIVKKELELTMRKCNKDLENNWLAVAATGDRCREVARGLDRLGLRRQLPDSAVKFLETKLTCSGAQLAREFSRRVSGTLGKMVRLSRALPDRAPIAAPFHPWSGLRNIPNFGR